MISQVANTSVLPSTTEGARPVIVDFPKASAPVELPVNAVKAVGQANASFGDVKSAADNINRLVQQFARNLEFTVDEETGIDVVKVVDTQSQEVIRQMPTEEMLAIAKALDKLQGMLIKDKV